MLKVAKTFFACAFLFFVIAVAIAMATEPAPKEEGALPALSDVRSSRKLEVGGVYPTFDVQYLAARSADQLRRGIAKAGAARRSHASDELLAREGLNYIEGRHKVEVVALEDDGLLVKLRSLEVDEEVWTVAAAVATPYLDNGGDPILVGRTYELADDALAATTIAGVERAYEAYLAELPDDDTFDLEAGDTAVADRERAKAFAKVGSRPGFALLRKGQRLAVLDFDLSDSFAVKVRTEGIEKELWVWARELAPVEDRLPAVR